MQKDISPEEKLLSIIKGNHEKAPAEKDAAREAAKDVKSGPDKPGNKADEYIELMLKSSFFKNNIFDPDVLRVFNRCTAIIAVIIILYFIADILFVRASNKAHSVVAGFSSAAMPLPISPRAAKAEAKNYSYYSNKIAGKKIFTAGSYISAESMEGADGSGEKPESNIGLVGIIPGDSPQAIIEEKKEQKTYYLIKGQSINGITVEDIDKDKVMIEYKGKRINLFL